MINFHPRLFHKYLSKQNLINAAFGFQKDQSIICVNIKFEVSIIHNGLAIKIFS